MFWYLLYCFCLVLRVACQPDDYVYEETGVSSLYKVPVIVFNAFPYENVTAFILFEEGRLNRIPYGEFAQENILVEAHDDFLFEYRQRLSEEVVLDYIGYGFVGSNVDRNTEVLIVLNKISVEANAPFADLLAFNTNIEAGFSKLYIYNAVTTSRNMGLNFYSLYLRRNSDGSESESIAQLANNLDANSGIDVNVEPNLVTQVKGFYQVVNSVDDFKLETAVVTLDYLKVKPGKRHYLVAFGVDGSSIIPTGMKEIIHANTLNSGSDMLSVMLLLLISAMCLCMIN